MIITRPSQQIDVKDDASVDAQSYARAILNILDDATEEKLRMADTQRAVINILDDFDIEKGNVERVNIELRSEIAERTRAEEALRHANALVEAANRELEAFSYSVAHDLRAPLRSIDGFSQALLEDYCERLDEEGKSYLGRVRESAQHMAQLIDALLSLSRLSRAELNRTRVDLAAIARSVFLKLERAQPARSVEFVANGEVIAMADARLIRIVIENILGNAWKFTSNRACARIEFGTTSQSPPTTYFIRDDGAGFDMAYAEKLFAVFQRLHTTREFEGTGIGLATVQRIIHRHGGRIWAEGAVGLGATFYFTLEEGG